MTVLVLAVLTLIQHPSLEVRFIGNTAVSMTDGSVTVITDFPYESGYSGYMTYAPSEIRSATSTTLALITHRHRDHWQAPLFSATNWKVAGPPDVTAGLPTDRVVALGPTTTFGPVTIERIETPHANVGHYSYILTWHGRRMYFSGDTESVDSLAAARNLDAAFVSSWLYRAALRRGIRIDAKQIVIYHHHTDERVAECADRCMVPEQGRQIRLDPVPPAPRDRVAAEMLQLARVGAADVVFDLGSIESVPIAAAERFGARGVGVGLERAQAESARRAAQERGVGARASFIEGGLLTAPYADATVVTLDLTPALNLQLEPILRRELRPGSRIVSRRSSIGTWRAEERVQASDGTTLFLWTVPRRPARTPDIFFVPTPQRVAEQMLELAGVTDKDVVYDLGSGDGRLVVLAAQNHGARGVGIEIDPELVDRARLVAREAQLAEQVRFVEGDLFDADVSAATVVTLFLSERINRRLEAKLKRELKPGARVVSRQFGIGQWTPDRTVAASDGTTLYLWTIR